MTQMLELSYKDLKTVIKKKKKNPAKSNYKNSSNNNISHQINRRHKEDSNKIYFWKITEIEWKVPEFDAAT